MTWTGMGDHIVAVGWQSARLMTVEIFKTAIVDLWLLIIIQFRKLEIWVFNVYTQ